MIRDRIQLRTLAAAYLLLVGIGPVWSAPKPNIIVILADDYGIGGVGCYSGPYKTPHLDALAKSGTRFDHCFSAPLCGPSRSLLLTGRYGFRTGVLTNPTGPKAHPDKDGCIARQLKAAGYATAVAGKWRQLGHFTTREDGRRWGFDEFLIWGVSDDGSADKKGVGSRYWAPDFNRNGEQLKGAAEQYGPDLLHDFAVDFIRRNGDKPFFLYYPTPLVHGPIEPTPATKTDVKEKEKATRKEKGKQKKARENNRLYADNIAYLDAQVGRLIAELDRQKLRERTLVLFVGDNGCVGQSSVHGRAIDGRKGTMQEGGSRVPLIASWPGTTPEGAVCDDLIEFTDFYPTLLAVSGAKPPTGLTLDGHSFAARLRGQTAQPREWVYIHLGNSRYVRERRWKLDGGGRLFDMSDAPFAQQQVITETADSSAARARLQAALDKLGK